MIDMDMKVLTPRPVDTSKHDALKEKAKKILQEKGVEDIRSEFPIKIKDRNFKIDIVGLFADGTKILVECGNINSSKLMILLSEYNRIIVVPHDRGGEEYFEITSRVESGKLIVLIERNEVEDDKNRLPPMESTVRKIGGSLYFHIPKTSAKAYNIKEGDIWDVKPKEVVRREPNKKSKVED